MNYILCIFQVLAFCSKTTFIATGRAFEINFSLKTNVYNYFSKLCWSTTSKCMNLWTRRAVKDHAVLWPLRRWVATCSQPFRGSSREVPLWGLVGRDLGSDAGKHTPALLSEELTWSGAFQPHEVTTLKVFQGPGCLQMFSDFSGENFPTFGLAPGSKNLL